jgi:hypothetical protein
MQRNIRPAAQLLLIVTLSTSITDAQTTNRTRARESKSNAGAGPLSLAEQGSFFVNEQPVETSFPNGVGKPVAGHISVKGMYVQYQIPQARNRAAYPVIMVHGLGHTGKTYENTPDGRMGWAEYFVRHGVATYIVDHAGRG